MAMSARRLYFKLVVYESKCKALVEEQRQKHLEQEQMKSLSPSPKTIQESTPVQGVVELQIESEKDIQELKRMDSRDSGLLELSADKKFNLDEDEEFVELPTSSTTKDASKFSVVEMTSIELISPPVKKPPRPDGKYTCAYPLCSNESGKLRCPICVKEGIDVAFSVFCSQDHFNAAWKQHKLLHSYQI